MKRNGHIIIALILAFLTGAQPVFADGPVIWSGKRAKVLTPKGLVTSSGQPLDYQGARNYVANPSATLNTTGWTCTGTMTVSRVTAGLPRATTTGTGLSFASGSADDYCQTCFDLDAADTSKLVGFGWAQAPSSYTDGDIKAEAYSFTAADCGGTATALQINEGGSNAYYSIPNATTTIGPLTFSTTTATHYGVRYTRVTGSSTLVASDVTVTPDKSTVVGAAVTDRVSFTTTCYDGASTQLTITQGTGYYSRIGDKLEGEIDIRPGTQSGTGVFNCTLPSGLTIDSTKTTTSGNGNSNWGAWSAFVSSSQQTNQGMLTNSSTLANRIVFAETSDKTSSAIMLTPANVSGLELKIHIFAIPIAEWAGGTVNLGQNQVEYACNSSTSDAPDTTSFVHGMAPCAVPGDLTAARTKRIRWTVAPKAGDVQQCWLDADGDGHWVPALGGGATTGAATIGEFSVANDTGFGQLQNVSGAVTDQDVVFRHYRVGTSGWSGVSGAKWICTKARPGVAVGFALATSTSPGLVKSNTLTKGIVESDSSGVLSSNNVWVASMQVESDGSSSTTYGGASAWSASKTGTGTYTVAFNSFWSAAPLCSVLSINGGSRYCSVNGAPTTTSAAVQCFAPSTATDMGFQIMCQGPR